MLGKTRQVDLRTALRVTFDGDEKHNCAHVEFRETGAAVQYRADVEYINVAPVTDAERRALRADLDLDVEDSGDRHIVFKREADSVAGAMGEVQSAASALDAGEATATKTFRAGTPGIFGDILAKIGLAGD